MASDSRGGAWLATAQELSRLDATVKIVVRETPFAHNEGDILVLAADPLDQSVWAAARQALKHIDAQGADLFAKSFSPPPIRDLALYRDATPPQLSFTAPTDGARLPTTTPQLILLLSYSDTGVGVDTSTLSIKASGNPLNVTCRFDTTSATCTPTTTLPLGANTLTATIKDFAGNQSAQATVSFTINQPPVAANDTATTPAGTAVAIAVLANDSDPDGDQLSVVGFTQGAHGTVSFANNIATYTPAPGFPPGTTAATDSFTYTITDGRGANATAAVTVTVTPVNQPPQVSAGPDQTITLPATASLHGSATDDGLPNPPGMVTVQWTEVSGPRTVTFGNAASLDTTASFTVAGVYVLRLTASDSALTASAQATVTVNAPSGGGLPPDPSTVAPPVEPGVAATIGSTTAFLYTGANPIQSGVAPGTIDAKRAAVLRGRVLDKANAPLPGVTITILNHAEFGQTLSRTDGMFDLAVSGGGLLTVNYAKAGLISAQRQVQVPWQDFVLLPGVVLIPPDSQITPVDLTATAPIQVARGSVQTDADGTRQATLLFPQGTQATMVMPNGTTQSITHLSVRATEFTVGPNGPLSMPAELPPTSGYTYAVMFTADEAKAAGATNVEFASPIPFYVENFLNFPVGTVAPLGAYDAAKGQWVASDSGQVVKILDITNNLADLDTTGNGTADNGAALGITLAERQQLATLYQAGQTLWRVAIPHFDFGWDINWGVAPPPDGKPPNPPGPPENDPLPNDLCGGSCCDEGSSVEGSIIDCGTQALGETAEVTGTPFSLNYQSSRVPGRRAAYTMTIPLSGATVPASLKRIDLRIILLGQLITQSFPAAPSQTTSFTWDGKDVYGRTVNGAQAASVRVGFVYNAVYAKTSRFGYNGNGLFITGNTSRELTIWGGTQTVSLGTWDARQSGLGGWALSVHHTYDPGGRLLYLGTGEQRSVDATLSPIISTVAGYGTGGDGGPATAAGLSGPLAIAAAPDGSFYIADTGHNCIRRVGPDGIISTVAGNGTPGSSGDGGPAIAASLNSPAGVAVGTDGSLYIVSDVGNQPVRRVGPDGFISTVAGNGTPGFSGDGGPATAASLVSPVGVAAAPDGSLYIADLGNQRIRRVGPDGIISTVAGNGEAGFGGDGGPAIAASLNFPSRVAVGTDGSFYIVDAGDLRIRRVGPDGTIGTVAGNGSGSLINGDGGPATAASLIQPTGVAVASDGSFYIADPGFQSIRRVGPDGIIRTVAGNGSTRFSGDWGPATAAGLTAPGGVAVGADSALYIADVNHNRIRRVTSALPGFSATDIGIPSQDGSELYQFNAQGRHLKTLNALTGTIVYQFAYDSGGRLSAVTDAFGNVTSIEHDASGNPTVIVAPFGQRTTLSVDANGYLNRITDPASEAHQVAYTSDGLLTSFTDPNGHASTMNYDGSGRLIKDTNAAGGSQSFGRTDITNGHQVARTTGLGRTTTYRVEGLTTGDQRRTNLFPDGTQIIAFDSTNGSHTTTFADGTVTTRIDGPDPRLGMLAAIPTSVTRTTGGLTATVTTARTVNLTDSNNPFSLTSVTDTVAINGRTSTRAYDSLAKTATTTTPAGRSATTIIDTFGRLASAQVSGLFATNNSYDTNGRLVGINQGSGVEARTLTFGYNPQGYFDTLTDPLGRQVRYTYDLAGRMTQQILPDGRAIQYAHDANGNLTSVTPPGKLAHVFHYTATDQTSNYVPPDVGAGTNSTVYTYDPDKALTSVARPDGQTVILSYDSAGRLNSLSAGLSPSMQVLNSYAYDSTTSKLSTIATIDGGTLGFTYNGALRTQTTWAGSIAGNVDYAYDSDFRVTSLSVNAANPITFSYDADSLLTQAGALNLTRSAQNGLLTGTSLGTITDSLSYNGFGEITSYSASNGSTPTFSTQITRDPLGRIAEKMETIGAVSTTYDYAYDTAGRLTGVKQNGVSGSGYTYDSNGNRLSAPDLAQTPIYDDQDRLLNYGGTSYTYTANGELATKSTTASITSYSYDVLGNLRSVALPGGIQIDYLIDGWNRRIGKKVNGRLTQGFLYQDQLRPIAELDGSNNVVSRFVYATHANVPDYMIKGGVTYRVITDHLGSPRLVINTTDGTIAQRMDYDEFGKVIRDTNPGFQPFGFAGGLYDRDTELVRFGARDYDATTGRWTAKDPIMFAGGDTNLYGYVLNDPLGFEDYTGLDDRDPHDVAKEVGQEVVKTVGEKVLKKNLNLKDPKGACLKEFEQIQKGLVKPQADQSVKPYGVSVIKLWDWATDQLKGGSGGSTPPPQPAPKPPPPPPPPPPHDTY